ncbi:HNH endonuclease [Halomonas sp. A29]|uniref:HNH endonuclease n=1 Tax=Halomonas sp. A29 TaxID=3102786 RepID=UPI00398B9B21
MAGVVARYQAISEEQNKAAIEACSTDLVACQEHSLAAANGEYARYGDDTLWDLPSVALPYMQALFDENIGVQNQFGEATISRSLMEGAGLAPEVAAMLAAMPVGYNRKTDPYHPQATRHQLESENGAGNVTSTTVPPAGGKNVALAGQRHPVTGVVYDQRGYPVFDSYSAYDTRLAGDDFQAASYRAQMRMATRDLRTQIQSNSQLKLQFNDQQLQAIQSGSEKIPGYTWHHHQDRGRMQLIDEDVHRRTGHLGGESMSGGQ